MNVIELDIGKIGVADSLDDARTVSELDAILFAAPLTEEIRLEREIAGVTSFAANVAAVSSACGCPILCGCGTRVGDLRHISVMTFAGGKLADIADRTLNLNGGEYGEGDTIKILRCKKFDLGLLVDTDILLAKNWQRIASRCDAVIGIGLAGGDADFAYIPTLAALFAKPYVVAFASGEIMWGAPKE